MSYRGADVFILAFSLVSKASYENVSKKVRPSHICFTFLYSFDVMTIKRKTWSPRHPPRYGILHLLTSKYVQNLYVGNLCCCIINRYPKLIIIRTLAIGFQILGWICLFEPNFILRAFRFVPQCDLLRLGLLKKFPWK